MSNQQKKNTFYGAAAILTVSTILVKIIGAIFKIPLIAILPEEAYGDFNGAYGDKRDLEDGADNLDQNGAHRQDSGRAVKGILFLLIGQC